MTRCIVFALAISTVPVALASPTDDAKIQTVAIAPLFYQRFACTEHVNGELSDLGDALGSDCLVLGGMGGSNGMIRLYKTDGGSNEDWYGWHVEVHAPFDGVVTETGVNRKTNTPGIAGHPPPGYIKFQRADGIVVVYAHLDDIRVHKGDHVGVGEVVALDGNNGTAKNPHVHVGAYSGNRPLQIRWDLAAEGRIPTLAHPQQAQTYLSFLKPHDVVLFQGDSITDGGRWREGQDLNHIMGQDYAYMISAKITADHPDLSVTFLNRGVGGDRVLDLASRWQKDTIELKPNLLSILVGINDTLEQGTKSESVEEYEQTYDRLLAVTLKEVQGVRIVLGQPFLLPVGKHQASYQAEMAEVQKRQAVVQRLAAKYHLALVPYQAAFDAACSEAPAEHWSWDGVHPTYAGHWLMMQTWLRTLDTVQPER